MWLVLKQIAMIKLSDDNYFTIFYPCPSQQQQEQDPTNLYISNLPLSMDEQELENMLKPFGHVISTRILRDANGLSRGVGFARYTRGNTHMHICTQTVTYTRGSSTYLVLLLVLYVRLHCPRTAMIFCCSNKLYMPIVSHNVGFLWMNYINTQHKIIQIRNYQAIITLLVKICFLDARVDSLPCTTKCVLALMIQLHIPVPLAPSPFCVRVCVRGCVRACVCVWVCECLCVSVVSSVTPWSVPVIRMQSGSIQGHWLCEENPRHTIHTQHTHSLLSLLSTFFSPTHTGFCLPSRQLVIELWLGEQGWIGADKEDMTHNSSGWMELLNRDKGKETP